MRETGLGFALTVLAGLMAGNCMLPMKFAKQWRWENIWLCFSLFSLLIIPWGLAIWLVHDLLHVYMSSPISSFVAPFLFGGGWGVAQILFGVSVQRLGMGLAYAIIVGLGAVLGTLVPFFLGQRHVVGPVALFQIIAGVIVMVVGIALTTYGGNVRESRKAENVMRDPLQSGYSAAVGLAVLCGFMAPMLNYAFAFGQSFSQRAIQTGTPPTHAAYAVWPIALLGGLLPNAAYSLFVLHRHSGWRLFLEAPAEGMWAVSMAILWMGAFALYGMSSVYLGVLGTSIGWALFQIFMILTAIASGIVAREWRAAPRLSILYLCAGMVLLISATALLARGNS